VAKETRKVIRNQQRESKPSAAERKAELTKPVVQGASELPDPFGPDMMKSTLSRVGLIVAGVWLVCGLIATVTQSTGLRYGALGLALVLTIAVAAVLIWTVRRTNRAREMAMLLRGVETSDDRKAALLKLESSGKSDAATLFAKAQLEMQEDPKRALETLESIDLKKEMPQVADEARIQRAMIHLTMGQVSLARQLVDNVDPKRQQDIRSKAMVASICAETWVRTGESKKAEEILAPYREPDEQLQNVRPQLLRAEAYLYAHTSQLKDLRRVLRQMTKIDVRLLGSFLQGKAHPLLMKEAKKMLEQSGAIPRKMMVQRPR
jgi:hypothetical protein